MKVAALYDVHGMTWALEAVLADIGDVDVVLFGGDLLYGPDLVKTIDLAREAGDVFVRGNCEREPYDWDRAQVSADDLPNTTAITPDELIEERFGGFPESTFVIGHTHHQFDRQVGGLRVVNAGSVGMPYESDVAAFWLLVEDGEPQFRRTPIDVERAVAGVRASGWPEGEEFIAENLLVPAPRDEAIAALESTKHG